MTPKLKKIKCNLSNKVISIYEDYYDKKIAQYGNEENLKKYYIQSKIISLIKSGHSIRNIAELIGFEYDPEKEDYYKELIKFHRGNILEVQDKNTDEIDEEIIDFIRRWEKFVHKKSTKEDTASLASR